jgi:hypothetical protein
LLAVVDELDEATRERLAEEGQDLIEKRDRAWPCEEDRS